MQKPGLFGMNGFTVFLLTCFSFAAHAQQAGYLILMDAENKQAFTVRIGDQMFTSSGHGHLVLSQLKDSSYRLNLSFPKKNLREQVFPVTIHQKDLGFQIKGNDSAVVLYNWQTKETIRPVIEKDSSRILEMGVKRDDGFSKLMASVVNDSSVMYDTYKGNGFSADSSKAATTLPPTANRQPSTIPPPTANRQPSTIPPPTANRQPSTIIPSTIPPPTANRQPSTIIPSTIPPPTANRQPSTIIPSTIPPPGVKKLREVSLKISRKIVFLDVDKDGHADTVTLFVFFDTEDTAVHKQNPQPELAAKKSSKSDSAASGLVVTRSKPALKSSEPGCGQLATDADAEFLRSAILKANTEQDKMNLATSAFEMKCFSVSQIRLLAGLFVSDKDRYKLMDAAHLHIADHEHFHELVDMLTDKNFQRKFLAMADKRS